MYRRAKDGLSILNSEKKQHLKKPLTTFLPQRACGEIRATHLKFCLLFNKFPIQIFSSWPEISTQKKKKKKTTRNNV